MNHHIAALDFQAGALCTERPMTEAEHDTFSAPHNAREWRLVDYTPPAPRLYVYSVAAGATAHPEPDGHMYGFTRWALEFPQHGGAQLVERAQLRMLRLDARGRMILGRHGQAIAPADAAPGVTVEMLEVQP